VKARWGIDLRGGEAFRAIHALLGSKAEYRRLDAFDLGGLGGCFDLAFCFGILHRVERPMRLLQVLHNRLAPDGRILIETYGVASDRSDGSGGIERRRPGEVYEGDAYVYWGFSSSGLAKLAGDAGFSAIDVLDTPVIEGHPRILAELRA
jgi:SAM-dependent methyltransferase